MRFFCSLGVCVPTFVSGLLLIYVFYYLLGLAPDPTGRVDIFASLPPRQTGFLLELLDHVLHLEPGLGQFQIVRFRAAGVDLAVEFLSEKVEPPADRAIVIERVAPAPPPGKSIVAAR